MILSILIGAGIYILLQIAFIGAVSPALLVSQHTWTNLGRGNTNPAVVALNAGPFYTVTKVAGLAWLAFVLRHRRGDLPSGHRADLPDLVLAPQLRPEQERLTSRRRSRRPTSGPASRCSA